MTTQTQDLVDRISGATGGLSASVAAENPGTGSKLPVAPFGFARPSAATDHRKTLMEITWSLVAGGAETYALTVASNLDRRDYRPMFCAVDQGGALEGELDKLGIPFTILHRRPGIQWSLMWKLYQLFRKENVRIIHTHHFNQLFYSALAAKLAGVRIIHTEHSVVAYKSRRRRVLLRLMSYLCHCVTAVGSDGEKVLLEQVGIPQRKLRVIGAGVDLAKFNSSRSEARSALGLSPQHKVLTIIARLYPEKNHKLLLAAFRLIVQRIPDVRLLIAGEGIERAAIEQEIVNLNLQQHVRMMGVRRDVPQLLAACDAFVLCSDREGLPIAVLEAMAAGRPVVATSVGDLPRVVEEGRSGLLTPPRDPQALAAALLRILSDEPLAERMGQEGRRLAEARYGIHEMVEQYETLYRT